MRTVKLKFFQKISVKDFLTAISKALCPIDIDMVGMDCINGWELNFGRGNVWPNFHPTTDGDLKLPGTISEDDRVVLEEVLKDLPKLHMRMSSAELNDFHEKYLRHPKSTGKKLLLHTAADTELPGVVQRMQSISEQHFLALQQMVTDGGIFVYASSGLRTFNLRSDCLLTKEQVNQYANQAGLIVEYLDLDFPKSSDVRDIKDDSNNSLDTLSSDVKNIDLEKAEKLWFEQLERANYFSQFIIEAQKKSSDPRNADEVFQLIVDRYEKKRNAPEYIYWKISDDNRLISVAVQGDGKKRFLKLDAASLKKRIDRLYKVYMKKIENQNNLQHRKLI